MARFRKKPVAIEASQWFKNGDHPQDGDPAFQGEVVRYYRPPPVVEGRCSACGILFCDHGWIKTLEGGHIVCPGDWIITGVKGEMYPCKPDIFNATYVAVMDPPDGIASGARYDRIIEDDVITEAVPEDRPCAAKVKALEDFINERMLEAELTRVRFVVKEVLGAVVPLFSTRECKSAPSGEVIQSFMADLAKMLCEEIPRLRKGCHLEPGTNPDLHFGPDLKGWLASIEHRDAGTEKDTWLSVLRARLNIETISRLDREADKHDPT